MLEDNQSSMFRFLIGNASLSQRMVTDKYLSNAAFHLKKKKERNLTETLLPDYNKFSDCSTE